MLRRHQEDFAVVFEPKFPPASGAKGTMAANCLNLRRYRSAVKQFGNALFALENFFDVQPQEHRMIAATILAVH